jgi:hypothetical protein
MSHTRRRISGRATLLALFTSSFCAWLGVAAIEWSSAVENPLAALGIALLWAGPAILPAALFAGFLAARGASSGQRRSLARWLCWGFLVGGGVGGFALGAWVTAMSLDLRMFAFGLPPGAAAGAVTGSVVALDCWRAARTASSHAAQT